MTVTEARKLLNTPLVFGNPSQILARDILREVDDCKNAMLACDFDHFRTALNSEKSRRAIRFCECVEPWQPDECSDDWSIVDAAIVAAINA
jgi:hypothetical protein